MTIVFNNLEKPDGQKLERVVAGVALTWDKTISPIIKNNSDQILVYTKNMVGTDGGGRWEIVLEANSTLTPASVYVIEEFLGNDLLAKYYINVGVSVDPVWVGNIIVATPAWEA